MQIFRVFMALQIEGFRLSGSAKFNLICSCQKVDPYPKFCYSPRF